MKASRRLIALSMTAVTVAALVLAGCGSSSHSSSSAGRTSSAAAASSGHASAGKTFTILYIGDLTGPTKLFGEQDWVGLRAAAAYWNQRGGIDGDKIVTTSMSDNGDATTAVSDLSQYLSSHPKPNWVYAGSESDELEAMIPVLKRDGLLGGGLNDGTDECATNAQTACPTTFWLGSPETDQTAAAASYLKQRGFKKIGLLVESLAYTESEATQLVKSLKAVGLTSVEATFAPAQVSLTPEVDELKSAGADALFVAALGAPDGYATSARAALNFNVPILFDLASSSADITKLAPASQLKDTYEEIFRSNNASLHLPGATALLAAAKQFGGVPKGGALDTLAYAWDDLVALHDAAQQAHSASQSALVAAYNHLDAAAQSDPLYLLDPHVRWTPSDHDTVAATPADYYFVPVAPLVNGQVATASH